MELTEMQKDFIYSAMDYLRANPQAMKAVEEMSCNEGKGMDFTEFIMDEYLDSLD